MTKLPFKIQWKWTAPSPNEASIPRGVHAWCERGAGASQRWRAQAQRIAAVLFRAWINKRPTR
jgi:hypothetical protein